MGYFRTKWGFWQENHKKKKWKNIFKSIKSDRKHFAFCLIVPQFHTNSVPAVSI